MFEVLCYNITLSNFQITNFVKTLLTLITLLQILFTTGRLKYQKIRRGTGPPTEVCGACEAAELAPGGVGEVLVELLGEVPGEVLALFAIFAIFGGK